MTALLVTDVYSLVEFAPRWTSEQSAGLLVLAASLLVLRTFREQYLVAWILGWLAYIVSQWTARSAPLSASTPALEAVSHAGFILAVGLFATSVLIYSNRRSLLFPLALVSVPLIGFALAQSLLWPNVELVRLGFEISYRLILLSAAYCLVRFRWARGELGVWIFSFNLALLHLPWAPLDPYFSPRCTMLADVLFGVSILLVVFDDSRMRTRRLNVVQALTMSTTRAEQHGPMMLTALEQLKSLMLADAAWFRLIEDGRMVISQQIGLSRDFLRERHSVSLDDLFQTTLSSERAVVLTVEEVEEPVRTFLKNEGFRHCVLVPVRGKKSAIGVLTLGSSKRLAYAPDDLEFLATSAHQLGLAVENLRLVEQILRSHRQWSSTFDSIQDVVLLHDSNFKVMKANHALLARLQLAPADLIGNTCEDALPHVQDWRGCPYCSSSLDGFHEGADPAFGGYAMVSTSTYIEQGNKQKGTIHVVRDISDRRVAEEKYRLLFEQVQEGVFVATPEGQLCECNEAFVQLLGYASRRELMELNIETDLYASPDQREVFRRQMEAYSYVRNFEVMLRRKDGSLITAIESSFATRDHRGKIERHQGFLLDITEKKRAEDEIRRRNRELNALNAMAVIATQSFDLDEILNLTLRQVISLLSAETGSIYLCGDEDTSFRRRAVWGQRSAGMKRLAEVKFADGFGDLVSRSRAEVLTQDYLPHLPVDVGSFVDGDGIGTWIWVLLWGKDKPIGIMGIGSAEDRTYSSNDENLLVAISRQLATTIEKVRLYEESCRAYDDLRRTQEQLLQSEKMSAVGQLISGVAHELNNPLTAILGYAQLLESEGLNDKALEFTRKLFKQAQRTHRVVQNLLSFARQRKPIKQDVDVSKCLDETLGLRDYDLKVHNVTVVREVGESIPAVKGDPHQLEQVFLNIINNSVDAMLETSRGGLLTVKVWADDGRVCIEFKDSGPGLKEPSRIFEPFYTTKSVGKGTGLGLSICYGIVKEHGGDITARNGSEGGAIIEVRLPACGAVAQSEETATQVRREGALAGKILLVEDEEAMLEFERDVLTGAGAHVTGVRSFDEMTAAISQETFDGLIVNGVVGGGQGAIAIHRWICDHSPELQKHVLFTFANVLEPEISEYLQGQDTSYMIKPFEVAELMTHARRIVQRTFAASAG